MFTIFIVEFEAIFPNIENQLRLLQVGEQTHIVFAARDPVIIERSNLVNISKLIVKELIETSLKYGRMLDSDHMPLQHFFIVLEHVLRHGLRPKKVKVVVMRTAEQIFH